LKSFQEDFYLEKSSPLRRLGRDLRLFGYVLQVVWFWVVRGGHVRRAVRRARRTADDPFLIDSLGARRKDELMK